MSRLTNHTLYLNELDPMNANRAVQDSINALKDLRFDAIAFSGMSGALIAPSVAMALLKPLILVRKDSDDCHAGKGVVEGALDANTYIIIDDFMSYGDTVRRIHNSVNRAVRDTATVMPHKIVCVGIYLYRYNELLTAEKPGYRQWLTEILSPMPPPQMTTICEYTGTMIGLP